MHISSQVLGKVWCNLCACEKACFFFSLCSSGNILNFEGNAAIREDKLVDVRSTFRVAVLSSFEL